MHIHIVDENFSLEVVMQEKTDQLLKTTCFRSGLVVRAGNFSRWANPQQMFSDPEVIASFKEEVQDIVSSEDDPQSTFGFTGLYPEVVGWASTVPASAVPQISFDRRKISDSPLKDAYADFVTDITMQAPQTRLYTIIYELKRRGREGENKWVAIIYLLYPGLDVGELQGDVSQRESRVFFDFAHPASLSWVCDD